MAFVTCPGCGKQTSDSVSFCVHCGCAHRLEEGRGKTAPRKSRENAALDWLKVLAGLIALGYALHIFGGDILSRLFSAVLTVFSMVRDIVLIIINL